MGLFFIKYWMILFAHSDARERSLQATTAMDSSHTEPKNDGSSTQVQPRPSPDQKDIDQAYVFLTSINEDSSTPDAVDQRRLRTKVDWHVVPIMFLCYCVSFIDKVSLNVGATLS